MADAQRSHFEVMLIALVAIVAVVGLVSLSGGLSDYTGNTITGNKIKIKPKPLKTMTQEAHAAALKACEEKGGSWRPKYRHMYSVGTCQMPTTPAPQPTPPTPIPSPSTEVSPVIPALPAPPASPQTPQQPSTTPVSQVSTGQPQPPQLIPRTAKECRTAGGDWVKRNLRRPKISRGGSYYYTCVLPNPALTQQQQSSPQPQQPVVQSTPVPQQPCTPKCTSECGGENDGCNGRCPHKILGTSCTSRSLLVHNCNGNGACVMKNSEEELKKFEQRCTETKGTWKGISNQVEHPVSRTDKISPCDCREVRDYEHPTVRYYPDFYLGCIPWV